MRRSMLLGALLCVAVACGSNRGRSKTGGEVLAPVQSDAGPLAEGCPPSWEAAKQTSGCDAEASPSSCHYPAGTCDCGVAPRCSGAEIDPRELQRRPTVWNCTPRPPEVRADGCPGTEPSGSCGEEGKTCRYGSCCVSTIECRDGRWETTDVDCPP